MASKRDKNPKRDKTPGREYPRTKAAACRFYEDRAEPWDLEMIGRRLLETRRSPDEYWAFVSRTYGGFPGVPRCLSSPKAWSRYGEYCEEQPAIAAVVADADVKTFEGRIKGGADVRKLLQDVNVGLSPLFRLLACVYFGFYDLAPKFRDKAELQLRENPEYFKQYGDLGEFMPIREEECYESQL